MKRMLLAVIAAVAMILAPTTATAAAPVTTPNIGAPTNLAVADITTDSATATWDPPAHTKHFTGYLVTWASDGTPNGMKITAGTARTASLKNLKPKTTYTVKVTALTRHGVSAAATKQFTTKAAKLAQSAYTLANQGQAGTLTRTPVSGGASETIATGVVDFASFPGGAIYSTSTGIVRHDENGNTVLSTRATTLVGADNSGNAYVSEGGTLTKIAPDKTSTTLISGLADVKDVSVAPNGLVMVMQSGGSPISANISIVKDGKLTETRTVDVSAYPYSIVALSNGDAHIRYRWTGGSGYVAGSYLGRTETAARSALTTHIAATTIGIAPDESAYVAETEKYCYMVSMPHCTQDYTILTITKFTGKNKVETHNVKGFTMMGDAGAWRQPAGMDATNDGRIIAATSTPTPQLISYGPTGGDPTVLAPLPAGSTYAKVQIN